MRPQTLISVSLALFLGLMSFVFTGTEAAPIKAKAVPMKSATPAKRVMVKPARINVVKPPVLKPGTARTKGKYTLKVTLHNPTATKAPAFGVKVMHLGRVVGKANLKGLNARARVSRTLQLNLSQQKGLPCVTVRLIKPLRSKLKLGTARRTCLKSSMVIRGIAISPKTKGLVRGRTTSIRQTKMGKGIIAKTRDSELKYSDRAGVLHLNEQSSYVTLHRDEHWKLF